MKDYTTRMAGASKSPIGCYSLNAKGRRAKESLAVVNCRSASASQFGCAVESE